MSGPSPTEPERVLTSAPVLPAPRPLTLPPFFRRPTEAPTPAPTPAPEPMEQEIRGEPLFGEEPAPSPVEAGCLRGFLSAIFCFVDYLFPELFPNV